MKDFLFVVIFFVCLFEGFVCFWIWLVFWFGLKKKMFPVPGKKVTLDLYHLPDEEDMGPPSLP